MMPSRKPISTPLPIWTGFAAIPVDWHVPWRYAAIFALTRAREKSLKNFGLGSIALAAPPTRRSNSASYSAAHFAPQNICDFNGLFIAGMAASHSESAIKPLIANESNSANFSEYGAPCSIKSARGMLESR
jgi:hypothetical protein